MRVAGLDDAIYPPMSEQLRKSDIPAYEGFDPGYLSPPPDTVVIGNAKMARGKPAVEYVLDTGLPYTSGAEWLGREILPGRHVIAISGTHGKTTTTAMTVWILEQAGMNPGYLIGGVPKGLESSARLGSGACFVVEADEYDTSYFDRRSKFLHYRPKTLTINNLEYDHADIFPNLEAIQDQFHHLLRAVPAQGLVVVPRSAPHVDRVLQKGIWSPVERISLDTQAIPRGSETCANWTATGIEQDASRFSILHDGTRVGQVTWQLFGDHNVENALAALAAAHHAGVNPEDSCHALSSFPGVHRRMAVTARRKNLTVYDDFAHHPTEIASTLAGLRCHVGKERILAVIEPRTHTMSLGTLKKQLRECCGSADEAIWFRDKTVSWDIEALARESAAPSRCISDIAELVDVVCAPRSEPTHVVIMSNGGFHGIYQRIAERFA